MKFALRPTHHNIEAMQMAGDMYDIMAVLTWLQRNGYAWFHPAVDEEVNKAFYIDEDTSEVVLEAHGVIRRIRQGDWIAKNQNGELNVYSPEEFRKLYMPVD